MKRISLLTAMTVLAFAALGRADTVPDGTPQPPQPAAHTAAPCADAPACHGKRRPLLEWLTYRPLRNQAPCCKQPACCRWPLYTWFLDYCQAGCGGVVYPVTGAPAVPAGDAQR